MKRILVIDDDPSLRELTRLILRKAGYETDGATDGLNGLKQLGQQTYDHVITDMLMPGMEGLELLLECRRLYPGQRFLAISGGIVRGAFDALPAAQALGALETLSKPFTPEQLLEAVKRCLAAPPDGDPASG